MPFAPKTCLRGTGIEDGKQACLFNMSRTLSISNNGPRAMNSPLALFIFSGVPVRQRVSGSTLVRQFNIRPLHPKRRCISLLRPAPSPRPSVRMHGGFAAARKSPRMGANARRVGNFRERPGYVAKPCYPASTMLPTARHQHASSRAIARGAKRARCP